MKEGKIDRESSVLELGRASQAAPSREFPSRRPALYGLLSALALFSVYMSILTLSSTLGNAWDEFWARWPWFTTLLIGFGVQIGLVVYVRSYHKFLRTKPGGTGALAASASLSGGAMLACCLHYVTNVLPFLGLSAAALFVSEYQVWFLAIGIASGFLGASYILSHIQEHKMYVAGGILSKVLVLNWKMVFRGILVLMAIGSALFTIRAFAGEGIFGVEKSSSGIVVVSLVPKEFRNGELIFEISVNTHVVGDLEKVDLMKAAVLNVSGKQYYPVRAVKLKGHHSRGELVYKLAELPEKLSISIAGLGNTEKRDFSWP